MKVALALLAAVPLLAQTADLPHFAAASVKQGADFTLEVPMSIRTLPGGRFSTTNAPVSYLIQRAYDMQPYQVSGGPKWINVAGFNIDAKPEGNVDQKQTMLMLQTLLAERFQLKFHRETRQLPVFAITVAKGGPRLNAASPGPCNGTMPGPGASPEQRRAPPCGPGVIKSGSGLNLSGHNLTMAKLCAFLGKLVGREVVDRTGVTRPFDLTLDMAFDEALTGLPHPPPTADSPADPLAYPTLVTAMQEQLGLKLESSKGPVEMLVIDRLEKPTEN